MCSNTRSFHCMFIFFFFFKQKTAYEMRISDWSSDVCSSDLREHDREGSGEAVFQVLRRDAGGFLRPDVDQLHRPGAVVVALQRAGTARAGADCADIDEVGVLVVTGDEDALAGAGVDRGGERDEDPFRRSSSRNSIGEGKRVRAGE